MGKKSNKSTASSGDDKKKKDLITFKVRSLNDNVQPVEIRLEKSDLGSKLFERYCESICPNGNFVEKYYFGLRFTDKTKQRQWLELDKSAYKQLCKLDTYGLSFRVKHYPEDPTNELTQDISKYLFYLQIRRDLTQGRLICTERDDQAKVGGAIFQAELGDSPFSSIDELENKMKMFSEKKTNENPLEFIKDLTIIYEERNDIKFEMAKKHIDFKGFSKQEAENLLLSHVCKFHTYGIDPFLVCPIYKKKNVQPSSAKEYIGLSGNGIMTFIETRKNMLYPWDQVTDIMLDGSKFIFTYHTEKLEVPRKAGTLKAKKSKNAKESKPSDNAEVLKYECFSKESAIALWKWTLDRKSFFTLKSAEEAKKIRSKNSFFNRGKSFKFSGHSKYELAQSNSDAPNPEFLRTTSFKRSVFINENLPNLNYRSTMPSKARANISALINDNLNDENLDSKMIHDKPKVKRPGVSIALKSATLTPPTSKATNEEPIVISSQTKHLLPTLDIPVKSKKNAKTSEAPSIGTNFNDISVIKPANEISLNASIPSMDMNSDSFIQPTVTTNVAAGNSPVSPLSPIGLMQNSDLKKTSQTPSVKIQPEAIILNPRTPTIPTSTSGSKSEEPVKSKNPKSVGTLEKDVINMMNSELDRYDTNKAPKEIKPKTASGKISTDIRGETPKVDKIKGASSTGSHIARNISIVSFFLLLLIAFIIVMESKSLSSNDNNPVIDYAKKLRDMPAVNDFAERFYQPTKDGASNLIKNFQAS